VDAAYVDGLMGVEAVAVDGKVDLGGFRVLVESLREHGTEEQARFTVILFLVVLYYTSGRGPDLFEACHSILKAVALV
jgi:hypothetical protein